MEKKKLGKEGVVKKKHPRLRGEKQARVQLVRPLTQHQQRRPTPPCRRRGFAITSCAERVCAASALFNGRRHVV